MLGDFGQGWEFAYVSSATTGNSRMKQALQVPKQFPTNHIV